MEQWLKISLLLCTFGFFREFTPSDPFGTEYLSGNYRNITTDQVNREVYPFGTYAHLAQLIIVFLVTDFIRYKPIIVLSTVAGIIVFAMLLWTRSLLELQIAQIFYGTVVAAEVAYYTYIYTKVSRDRYQIVTGHSRAAILSGQFLGGVLAQVLVSTGSMDFRGLHFLSFASQIISLPIALMLPRVPRSLYFHVDPENVQSLQISEPSTKSDEEPPKFSFTNAGRLLRSHFISSYTNPIVVEWSVWWALATCGQILVVSYIQFLWKEVAPNNFSVYNGGVEAVATLLGALGAISAGMLNSNKRRTRYMLFNSTCMAVLGVLLLVSARTDEVWLTYIGYAIFSGIFFFIITVAGAIVAENVVDDSFGLVFGINTLAALILQTILTIVVVTDSGFGLSLRGQYMAYGFYFLGVAALFLFFQFLTLLFKK
ncbi:thiamine transporter 1-like [Scaptodrosophila lebanonensis]|uniref:Thiamine transporter 1-like n=1 Tax=Drosophila lebanonensis TaxID=7225 RepID=A0A6J2U4C0_DROLE|nr:thiamine transporter 1-like [Scaptodrosophila lebanonensis]